MAVILISFALVAFFAIGVGGLRSDKTTARGATNLELVVAIAAVLALLVSVVLASGDGGPCRSYGRGAEVGEC